MDRHRCGKSHSAVLCRPRLQRLCLRRQSPRVRPTPESPLSQADEHFDAAGCVPGMRGKPGVFQRGQRYAGGTVLPARPLRWRSAMFRRGLRPKRPGPDPDRDGVTFPSVPRLRVHSRAGAQAGCNESLAFLRLGFDSGCVESWKTARPRGGCGRPPAAARGCPSTRPGGFRPRQAIGDAD